MSSSLTSDDDLVRAINQGVDEARVKRRVIDTTTARQIAAAIHRGLGSELERFAGTGRIRRHQVARLELHYLTADEPQMKKWREALLAFITDDQRKQASSSKTDDTTQEGGSHDAPCS